MDHIWNRIKSDLTNDAKESYAPQENSKLFKLEVDSDNLRASQQITQMTMGSSDIMIRNFIVNGIKITLVMCEGLFSSQVLNDNMIKPLIHLNLEDKTPLALYNWINNNTIIAGDQKNLISYDELFHFIMSGFVVILVDGVKGGIACGLQGFHFRSVSEPSGETNIRGSREGFVEAIRINVAMVRRRMKTPNLKFELLNVGEKSKTDVCLAYRTDCVDKAIVENIKSKLSQISIDNVMESGYIQPFLDTAPLSIFSSIGTTQRPDVLLAKISEGRVGVLVDGTPFALVIPQLFNEHFQCLDDYTQRPYFATLIRWIKYIAFIVSILLPGFYVAIATFHPELLPTDLLFNIASADNSTPFPLIFEALGLHLFYEILREAGLRLPKSIGHAVSIVGGLVIGDAAVQAGLVGAPMVIIVALTAITAFVTPSLYEPIMFSRFAFIFLGGCFGIFGMSLGIMLILLNLSAIDSYGIPASSPISPLNLYSIRDVFFRLGWKSLAKENLRVQNIPGSKTKT